MESVHRKHFRLITPRTAVLLTLVLLPLVIYGIVGALAVWQIGWFGWLWWVLPAVWLMTWLLARLWPAPPSRERLPPGSGHWTPRDERAAEIVQRYQSEVDDYSPEQLTDLQLYLSQAQRLAEELSRHYHPRETDPLSSLTVPEIVAACRLVADDLEALLLTSVPGSRMLTIGQWRKLGHAPKWIRHASNALWAASIMFNPANIASYGTSRLTTERVLNDMHAELLATMYLRFMRQVGFYLIEMNSGRLRAGADAYRQAFDTSSVDDARARSQAHDVDHATENPNEPAADEVCIALVGQTSAGKSSLINALIGQADAKVDILPATQLIERFRLHIPRQTAAITLLDTPGYGQSGATKQQTRQIELALEQADAVLLVLDAHAPARDADTSTLATVREHYQRHLHLKPPPILAVLTHVDLLSPVLVWSPPYDWINGESPKEKSMAGAIAYTREVFGDLIADAVPVCTDPDEQRRWGILNNLVPLLVDHLDQARSVSILAAFEAALSRDRIKILMRQAANSGKQILRAWLQERFER